MKTLVLQAIINRHKRPLRIKTVSGCPESAGGRNITRTRHNVMLHVNILCCTYFLLATKIILNKIH